MAGRLSRLVAPPFTMCQGQAVTLKRVMDWQEKSCAQRYVNEMASDENPGQTSLERPGSATSRSAAQMPNASRR